MAWKNWGDHPIVVFISVLAGLAGLMALGITLSSSPQSASISASPSSNQVAGSGSTQIGNVGGNVVINSQTNAVPETEKVDIIGEWNDSQASQIALSKLENANWAEISRDIKSPIEHTQIGQYSLMYKNREGIVLAYSSINKGSNCHACAPYLSFFEFEKKSNGWKLLSSDVAVWKDGSWGKPPHMSVRVIADDRFAVFLESWYMAQGWEVSSTTIHVRMADSFKKVLDLIIGQRSPEGQSWSSSIAVKPTSTGLYDLEVIRNGDQGPRDLVWFSGNAELKDDVANSDNSIRPHDIFKFDGQTYRRSELVR